MLMTLFGERFIREFERPLLLPGSDARALDSRLRFIPRQRRLDILLAPRNGHTYPNLSDHRVNVEYDVGRVLQRLKDKRFVSERLSVKGRWVIVRCRFSVSRPGGWNVSILLLSLGGGGGNILRSVKALFRRDLGVTHKIDTKYAERLKRAVSTRFLDTNEFSLSDFPREERMLIGARTTGRLGARHNADVAAQALEESRSEVEAALSGHSVVIVIGTGGKGTGAGAMFPSPGWHENNKSS